MAAGVPGLGAEGADDKNEALSLYRPRYNIAPAQEHLVLRLEWATGPEGRHPLWFHRPDGHLLLLAGLFDEEPTGAAPDPSLLRAARDDLLVAPRFPCA